MKTALFTNFTETEFIGYWDGKGKKFSPGQSLYMPDYLARHFAKHLTNRELLKVNANGSLVYKDGEKMTSPKKPDDSPVFMEIFNKAYTPDEDEETVGEKKDDIDTLINVANKNRNKKLQNKEKVTQSDDADESADEKPAKTSKPAKQDPKKPQVVLPPDYDEEDDDEEDFDDKDDK